MTFVVILPDISILPRPQMSKNLIYEDQRRVKNVLSRVVHQNYRDHPLTHPTSIDRGKQLFIVSISLVLLIEINIYFKSIDRYTYTLIATKFVCIQV